MAQYDILLTQNVAASGIEFSEKYVNLAKGSILSAATGGIPTVLAPGTNAYMLVRDDAEVTGLKWIAVSAGHTQGTDTGTTSQTFGIFSGSHNTKIKAELSTKVGIRNAADNAYIDLEALNATFAKVTVSAAPSDGTDLTNKTYVDGLLSANDAMVFKGSVGTGGTHEIAAFNSLATYQAGWSYRVITAGTIKGKVCEVGDLVVAVVDRSGSGNVDADWIVLQTNLDGAVIGPSSATNDNIATYNLATGKLIKDSGVAIGAISTAQTTATNAIPKAVFTATGNEIILGSAASTYAPLVITASTFFGRKATGNAVALTAAEARTILNVADGANNYVHPAVNHIPTGGSTTQILQWASDGTAKWVTVSSDISLADNGAATISASAVTLSKMANLAGNSIIGNNTGSATTPLALTATQVINMIWQTAPANKTSTGTLGMIAKDDNFFYICTATNVWKRSPIATNW